MLRKYVRHLQKELEGKGEDVPQKRMSSVEIMHSRRDSKADVKKLRGFAEDIIPNYIFSGDKNDCSVTSRAANDLRHRSMSSRASVLDAYKIFGTNGTGKELPSIVEETNAEVKGGILLGSLTPEKIASLLELSVDELCPDINANGTSDIGVYFDPPEEPGNSLREANFIEDP